MDLKILKIILLLNKKIDKEELRALMKKEENAIQNILEC